MNMQLAKIVHPARRAVLPALFGAAVLASPASAVPAFSSQTGMACAQCHVGGFGPQLTAFGRSFKMGGYTFGDAPDKRPPISAMAIASFSHTNDDVPALPHFSDNDNLSLDQVSAFIAGRMIDHVGTFIQLTYDGVGRAAAIDNIDLRYADDFQVIGSDVVAGVSINNNPGVQDPWNTLAAWSFPYTASAFLPSPAAGTQIDGALANQVLGASAYAMIDDMFYVEAGGYRSFSKGWLNRMGEDVGDRVAGVAPYWRLAAQKSFGDNQVSFGVFGLYAPLYPGFDRSNGKDKYTDYGFDATFQGQDGDNLFSINAAYVYERQDLGASFAATDVGVKNQHLSTVRVNASYYVAQKYGLTAGVFNTSGTTDGTRYAANPVDGSANGSPNSSGYVMQVDYTPFGTDYTGTSKWMNLRVGLQYTGYMEFNGRSSNYDGSGRDASDNNTIQVFTWFAF
jgi:hypothetical protein